MKGKNIMKATYDFQSLAKTYDNFRTPAAAIYSGAAKVNVVKAKGAAVENIQITLSAGEAAGLSFQVSNAFDVASHKMKKDILSLFSVGTVLEAALGYGSNLTTIFKGYIEECRTSYQENPVISITAVDFRKLMKDNKRKKKQFKEKAYSAIFKEVVGNYSSLYGTLHVDSTSGKETLTQNGSDYDFVTGKLCHLAKRNFFMVGSDVYFQKPPTSKSPFMELKWGSSLISFEKGSQYCYKKMIAYSSQKDKEKKSASALIKTASSTPKLMTEAQKEELELEDGLEQSELQNWVDKKVQEQKDKNETANGTVIGLPEIVPGRYIKISGVDSADEGTFYIREVRHSFGGDGFTTSFSVGKSIDQWDAPNSSREEEKSEKMRGVYRAIVKENWDEKHKGHVLVEFLSGEDGKNDTRWLPVMQPYCGKDYGMYFLPEIDTEVVVGSWTGDVNSLVVLGAMWNDVDELPKETANDKNTIKRLRTKGNHEIVFDDDPEKGTLTIKTAKNLHITMSEKEKTISVSDEEGKNSLELDGTNGTLKLKADKKLTLSVGDKNMLVLDKEAEKLTLEADHVEEKAGQDLKAQTQNLSVEGSKTELKADGSFTINSSGVTTIKGSMVQIN